MRQVVVFLIFVILLFSNTLPVQGDDEGSVTISLQKYAALQKLAGGGDLSRTPPPVDYFISGSQYLLRCEHNKTTLTCRIELEILGNSWIQIPLFDKEMPLHSARLDDSPAHIMVSNGRYALYLRRPGVHRLEMVFSLQSFQKAPTFAVDLISSSIASLSVDSSLKDLDITVSPGSLIDQSTSAKGISKQYVLPHEGVIKIAALTKQELERENGRAPAVINGEFNHVLLLGEALLTCETTAHVQILKSSVKKLTLKIPEGHEITSIDGEQIASQKCEKDCLVLSFNTPISGDYLLKIRTEKKLKGVTDSFSYKPVRIAGARREKGYVALAARTNVSVSVSQPHKATMVDVTDLPPELVSSVSFPILSAYKYLSPDCSLAIDMRRYQDVSVIGAAVDSAEILTVKSEEGTCISKAIYHVKNNMKQYMSVTLPSGSELWSVFVAGHSEKPGKDEKGNMLVPLQKSNSEEGTVESFPVELVYVSRGKRIGVAGMSSFHLPGIDIPISSVDFHLYLPDPVYVVNTSGMRCTDLGESDSMTVAQRMINSTPVIDNFLRARAQGQMVQCRSNQKNIGGAIELFNSETGKSMQAGILPVSVTIPARGQRLHFERLMVTSCAPSVRLAYVPGKLVKDTAAVMAVVIFFSAMFFFMKRSLAFSGKLALFRFLSTSDELPRITLLGKVLTLLAVLFMAAAPWSVVYSAGAALLGFILAFLSRKRLKPASC